MITADQLQGHWQRAWIRAPGLEDRTTHVHWLQAGAHFADIRVPAVLPDITGARALGDLGPGILLQLLACEGFAGTISVDAGVCTWHRRINWHGASDQVDAGRMSFDGSGGLVEEGVHASYTELWQRAGSAEFDACEARSDTREGVFLTSDDKFILGLGRPGARSSAAVRAGLAAGRVPEETAELFCDVYLYGEWDAQDGHVLLSTDPFLVGQRAVRRDRHGLIVQRQDFAGRPYEESVSLWEVGAAASQMAR